MAKDKKFRYQVATPDGRRLGGTIDASSKKQVRDYLVRERGFRPIMIVEEKQPTQLERYFDRFRSISTKDVSHFTRSLAVMLDAGIPQIQALQAAGSRSQNPKFKEIVSEIASEAQMGVPMHEAFAKYPRIFTREYVAMIRAGEEAGEIDKAVANAALQYERTMKVVRAIKGAMMYPKFVAIFAYVIISGLLLYMVPKFAGLFQQIVGQLGSSGGDARLPALTRAIVSISQIEYPPAGPAGHTLGWWAQVLVRTMMIPLAFVIWKRIWIVLRAKDNVRVKWDAFKLRAPRVGSLVEKIALARFARTFSALLRSGVAQLDALEITADATGNLVVGREIMEARELIFNGVPIADAFASAKHFDSMTRQFLETGDEAGDIAGMMEKLAEEYEDDVDQTIKGLTTLIEPLLMVMVGMVVGVVIISLYLPIFKMTSLVGNQA
jgi:type IV pilus assembly protein PilC